MPYEFIFDTGSSTLTINTSNCSRCNFNDYVMADSSSFNKTSNFKVQNLYASGMNRGYLGTETVCLDNNSSCVQDFVSLFVTYSNLGLAGDGIVGFSPKVAT